MARRGCPFLSVPGNRLWGGVLEHLRRGLSPEQIASTLARMPDPVRLSHETIYTALYVMPRGPLRASVLTCCAAPTSSAERVPAGSRGPSSTPSP